MAKTPDEFNGSSAAVSCRPIIIAPARQWQGGAGSHQGAALVLGETAAPVPTSAGEKSLLDKAADGLVYGDGIREKLVHEQRGTASLEAATTEQLVKDASETAQ